MHTLYQLVVSINMFHEKDDAMHPILPTCSDLSVQCDNSVQQILDPGLLKCLCSVYIPPV